ncbi:hypothetical protein EV356DRAFT_447580 [Viridothelium virens]|uniref:1-alkyl-2-acetylglycerophosphocholine esterase n=1 Tax=Viridothelium virens TaxID=1048519 RepID=A0A6A6H827_VIRVR|nr:hypothetical protein EV356DRAFT_447580 [Viridothelium virens]
MTSGTRKRHSNKPKSRPPRSFRDKLGFLNSTLPGYSGPYNVGLMDIEVPAQNPRTFSHITRRRRHLLQLETVLLTIYYPSAIGSGAGHDPAGYKYWSRQTWLPRPRRKTAQGFGLLAGLGDWITLPFFLGSTMFTKIPAFKNARLADHWPVEENYATGGKKVKDTEGRPPEGAEPGSKPTFPLILFSHGLCGTRTMYSSLCGEFASYGFVVCAVEHRDGSGPRTFVNHSEHGEGSRKEREMKGNLDHTPEEKEKSYDVIDYIWPQSNPYDTSPNNDKGVDRELRSAQMELRLAELEEAYYLLQHLCEGDGEEYIDKRNMRKRGYAGSSSRGLEGINWKSWQDRFNLQHVTMVGHSFGAATTVEVLRSGERFKFVRQGIIYDIWGAAVNPPADDPQHRIHTPLLGINSEAFMYWASNFDAALSLVKEAASHEPPPPPQYPPETVHPPDTNSKLSWLLTVRGTVHISQSDFSILYPGLCSALLKATADPKRALDLNIDASLEFLRFTMPAHLVWATRAVRAEARNEKLDGEGSGAGVLDTQLLTEGELPGHRRPEDKFLALRLKIRNEFWKRMVFPRPVRKARDEWRRNKGKVALEDEVWMHFKPTDEDLKRFGVDYRGREEDSVGEPDVEIGRDVERSRSGGRENGGVDVPSIWPYGSERTEKDEVPMAEGSSKETTSRPQEDAHYHQQDYVENKGKQ